MLFNPQGLSSQVVVKMTCAEILWMQNFGMRNLIVHITDPSTEFLCPIYQNLRSKTVLREPVTVREMNTLITSHDRVVMLGHGSPAGLFSMGFCTGYIIGDENAEALAEKTNSLFIWCHASDFVRTHGLAGVTSGMFISEVEEGLMCGIPERYCTQAAIDYSNNLFARLVGERIHLPQEDMLNHVLEGYQSDCPIIRFNSERLLLVDSQVRNVCHTI